jgi:hypothetical protein
VFVSAEGVRRAYKFKPSDTRLLEDQALERQLRAAAFLPTEKFDPASLSLGPGERKTPTFSGVPRVSDRAGMAAIDGASETAIVGSLSEALKSGVRCRSGFAHAPGGANRETG